LSRGGIAARRSDAVIIWGGHRISHWGIRKAYSGKLGRKEEGKGLSVRRTIHIEDTTIALGEEELRGILKPKTPGKETDCHIRKGTARGSVKKCLLGEGVSSRNYNLILIRGKGVG